MYEAAGNIYNYYWDNGFPARVLVIGGKVIRVVWKLLDYIVMVELFLDWWVRVASFSKSESTVYIIILDSR